MVNPAPGYSVATPFKKSSSGLWGTCGWHTGQDYPVPGGARIVAARPGTVKHVNYGSSLGYHQVLVVCSDGSGDFYAHMQARVPDGTKVKAGDRVGDADNEGNSTGSHLHFERHKNASAGWNCGNFDDPMKSHNYQSEEDDMPLTQDEINKIAKAVWTYDTEDALSPDSKGNPTAAPAIALLRRLRTRDQLSQQAAAVWAFKVADTLDGGARKAASVLLENIRSYQGRLMDAIKGQ